MTVPLYVLAFLAAVAGILVSSNVHFSLSNWIDPVFGGNLYNTHLSTGDLWALGAVDGVIAVVGVFVGLRIWVRRADHPSLEPIFLRGAWFINELYDAVFGRPSERLAAFCAEVVDPKVIDGAVNGIATAAGRTGTLVRRTQTGYVRNYVLGIVFGTVLVLAFMLTRLWWA
jgi:NADH-quinone oxidoreductase subunit L